MRASHSWCAQQHHATGSTWSRSMLPARWRPTRRPIGCAARTTRTQQSGRPPLPWQLHGPCCRPARCQAAVQPSGDDAQPPTNAAALESGSSLTKGPTQSTPVSDIASSTSNSPDTAGSVQQTADSSSSSSSRVMPEQGTSPLAGPVPVSTSPSAAASPLPPPAANAAAAAEATTTAAAAATAAPASGTSPTQQSSEAAAPASRLAALVATLRSLWLRLVAAVARLAAPLTSLPAWVARQRLAALAAEADAAPGDAPKQAAYLAGLNAAGRAPEVVTRVDSGKYGVSAGVVVEYITALVASRQLEQYARSSAADPAAPAAAGSSSGGAVAPEGAALAALLGRLQLAAAGGDAAGAAGEGGRLGSSSRRPLHVVLQGMGAYPGSSMAAQPSSRIVPLPAPAPLSPVARLAASAWNLVLLLVSLLLLAGLYLAGRATWRALATGSPLPGSDAAGAGASSSVVSSAGGAGAGPGGLSAGGGGSSAFDPKEYKKDELPETSVKTFADVKGCDESKAELQEVVEFLKNPTKFTRLGAKLPKGILLTGPPGTGKTLLAKAVAGEAGVPFFYRAGSEFEELYVGVGSRRMRALFAAAKKRAPCIVFIDEIDAIGGNRKHWENHTRKTLNQLLVEMDGFEPNEGVIVMAATNLPETLDPALKRPGRFDRMVAVPLPDVAGRRQMLDYYLGDKPVAPDVDSSVVARNTAGFSGADISNLVNEAALLAAKQGADSISASMLDWAYDKVLMGVERLSAVRTPEARRRTAYHEGGHALVAAAVAGASPLHKATIIPRGHALGMVQQMGRDDEYSISRQQMTARILVALGGTVAEELIYGRDGVTSGATDDLRQATEMARHMVMQCGLSEAVGPLYVADEKSLSESMKQAVDEEVRGMLVEARSTVKTLLTTRLEDLHRLAGALLEHETLTGTQIKAVLAGEVLLPPAGMTAATTTTSNGEVKVAEPVAAPEAV